MNRINPLDFLRRDDKWYLGGGNRLLWAPEFPLWLDTPGFWDDASYYNVKFGPAFTWTLLDEEGTEIPLRGGRSSWNPSRLLSKFTGKNLRIVEEKCCLPNDVLASHIVVRNQSSKRKRLHLIVWTLQPSFQEKRSSWTADVTYERGKFFFTRQHESSGRPRFQFECVLGLSGKIQSHSIRPSEGSTITPQWHMTPWCGNFQAGKLPADSESIEKEVGGVVYMALHTILELKSRGEQSVDILLATSDRRADASAEIHFASRRGNPTTASASSWNEYFSTLPHFACSDPYLTKAYWYRWYGLRLLTLSGGDGKYGSPSVCEGIGYFRAPISYSAMCHMLETRWRYTPELARGCLMNFIENQREDGSFPGYIDPDFLREDPFYHANWGNSLLALDAVHPSREFLGDVYEGLKKYAQYFDRHRDREVSGLYDVLNHYETGQEYMHRYLAVRHDADSENWGNVFRLKGVDATVYMYELKRALSVFARRLGNADEAELWSLEAERIRSAVLGLMWDAEEEMFFDVDPASGRRTMVKAAICFYPYMTDIVSADHVHGLRRHLFNPSEFWTPFPVPSSSADDPYFSAEGIWKGKRMNCPWNGRVWPMTNSHIAEALAQTAIRCASDELKMKTAEFISRYIRMMFFDGDVRRPNSFEHYNPLTGQPSLYRGVDDYQHSWLVDLIVKYVAGVRPGEGSVVIDPFPFGLDWFTIGELFIRGRRLRIEMKNGLVTVELDGKRVAQTHVGRPVSVEL